MTLLPPSVLLAESSDLVSLLEMLELRHREEGFGLFSPEKVRAMVERGISREQSLVGVIKGRFGLEASAGLYVGSLWDSTGEILSDLWHFVRPEHRKDKHAQDLLNFSKWASEELNRPLLMSLADNTQTQGKLRLAARHLERTGALFRYSQRPTAA